MQFEKVNGHHRDDLAATDFVADEKVRELVGAWRSDLPPDPPQTARDRADIALYGRLSGKGDLATHLIKKGCNANNVAQQILLSMAFQGSPRKAVTSRSTSDAI